MTEIGIVKTELPLDPDVQKQLVADVDKDIAPRELESPSEFHTTIKENVEFYHPQKWNDDHYVWLVELIREKLESIIKRKVRLWNYWFMRYKDGDQIEAHHHETPDWVTSYYFEAPEGSGALNFPEDNEIVYPYTGLLVAHPAHMVHEVLPNTIPDVVRYNFVVNWEYDK